MPSSAANHCQWKECSQTIMINDREQIQWRTSFSQVTHCQENEWGNRIRSFYKHQREIKSLENLSSRLEHVVADNLTSIGVPDDGLVSPSILSSITPYHIAAEQHDVSMDDDAAADRTSLNCEDGSLSSHSTGEHYAMEDIINRSRDSLQHPTGFNGRSTDHDENLQRRTSGDNAPEMNDEHQRMINGAFDSSFKIDEINEHSFNSNNRSSSINASNKSRSLKRKYPNGVKSADHEEILAMSNRIFHADAFCAICRKVRGNDNVHRHIFSSLLFSSLH